MLHFFSLSLKPTLLVGLNKDLELPSTFEVTCHAAPALFAYPPPLKEKKEAKKERVRETASPRDSRVSLTVF